MNKNEIVIKNTNENNLKSIDITIPKNKLVIVTGVSGSGKSSLAFDVLYNEGRRRYVNSLSTYAQQFLGGVKKPDVESITGLSPAIAIDQKQSSHNPRSTVGTSTEIYDFIRLLYAKIGIPHCPTHNEPITVQTTKTIVGKIYEKKEGAKIQILAPVIVNQKGSHAGTLDHLRKEGFLRVRVNGKLRSLDDNINLKKTLSHNIEILVDRVILSEDEKQRISEAINVGATYSDGLILINFDGEEKDVLFSKNFACRHGDFEVPKIEPRLFSFNSPVGACNECNGLGMKNTVTWELLINDMEKSVNEGGIEYFKNAIGTQSIEWQMINKLAKAYKLDFDKPLKNWKEEEKEIILYGSKEPIDYSITSASGITVKRFKYIDGLATTIERRYVETASKVARNYYRKFMNDITCHKCNGKRLNESALSVRVGGLNVFELTDKPIDEIYKFVNEVKFESKEETEISKMIIKEISTRLKFLMDVGLNYLSLSRMAMTLSGGESQRIRLASQLGSNLTGVLYVLDEPSIGLHQKDNDKLIETLKSIRDLGNTVIVVEHDEETMTQSDYIIDIGPGAGNNGGEVVFKGTPLEILDDKKSLTGQYLSGKKVIDVPKQRRPLTGNTIVVDGAEANNLKNIRVAFPLGQFIAVTGVSGSGKSTLVNEILYKGIRKHLNPLLNIEVGKHNKIEGLENVDKVIRVSQSAIGRTPRSNPATYTGLFDDIRDIFTATIESKERGYAKGRFSFNVKGGRCEKCEGDGTLKIQMNFMADVYVKCSECEGKRYNDETLEIKYKGKTISDILEMTFDEAAEFFKNIPKLRVKIQNLLDVGLGYIQLGHSAVILSGGEAQRVKLATHLQKRPTGKSVYILDEPTTGLHTDDIKRLNKVLSKIVDNGDTVIVIEHNLDMIKIADYVIDLGPDGGKYGGEVITQGTPEKVSQSKTSHTAKYLNKILKK